MQTRLLDYKSCHNISIEFNILLPSMALQYFKTVFDFLDLFSGFRNQKDYESANRSYWSDWQWNRFAWFI